MQQPHLESPEDFRFIESSDAPNRGPDIDAPFEQMAMSVEQEIIPKHDFMKVFITNSILSSVLLFAFDRFLLGSAIGSRASVIIGATFPWLVGEPLNLEVYRWLSMEHVKMVMNKPDPIQRRIFNPSGIRPMNAVFPAYLN